MEIRTLKFDDVSKTTRGNWQKVAIFRKPLQTRTDSEPLNQKLCTDTQIEAYQNQNILMFIEIGISPVIWHQR